jgi:lipid-A-disaccharide synthase
VREILFVAGETSGDLHAASVARELTESSAPFTLRGIGGDLMESSGVRLDEHIRDFAVLGLIEVLRHVPKHWRTLRALRARIQSGSVALVVLVDYPGFNMRVAQIAADAGVPVLYYIVPQVWAWGEDRLEKMARWIRKAAVILPFEEKLLRDHGIDATFVGHPLLDRANDMPSRDAARDQLGLPRDARVLALFPGSRAQEIARHLVPFVRTAELLRAADPSLHVIVSAAPHVKVDESQCPFPLVHSASLAVLRAADAALCKSGTTTLEAAVAGCPLAVAYRAHPVTYFAARRLVRIPNIGLVNVVAGKEIAPEFVQDALQPAVVGQALSKLIDADSPERQRMLAELARVRGMLGEPGAARRVAAIARELAEQGGRRR